MSESIIIKVKTEYQKMVPRPNTEEYNVLKESLLQNGQREPIIINNDGYILDGHTRYEILHERGINVNYMIKCFYSLEEERLYVIDCNLARRHLNAYQKVKLVYSIYKINRTGSGGNNRNKKRTGGAATIVGRTIGVNRNTVSMAAWLIENAPNNIKAMLEGGTISVQKAYKRLRENKRTVSQKYIRENQKLQCPHCKHNLSKKDLITP